MTVLVLLKIRIVLVRQLSPKGVDAKVLTPLETADEGNAVENLAVEVPLAHEGDVAVVEELHVLDEVEHVVLADVARVGPRGAEEGIGNLVPLGAGLEAGVNLAPGVYPPALEDLELGVVVGEVAPEAFNADGMAEAEEGGFLVDEDAALLGVEIFGSGLELYGVGEIGGGEEAAVDEVGGEAAVEDFGAAVGACEIVVAFALVESVADGLLEEGGGGFHLVVGDAP